MFEEAVVIRRVGLAHGNVDIRKEIDGLSTIIRGKHL